MIPQRLPRGIEQGDGIFPLYFIEKSRYGFRAIQLFPVFDPEELPMFFHIFMKPLPERRRRRQTFFPIIILHIFLFHSPGPQSVYQHPVTVGRLRIFVYPFDSNFRHPCFIIKCAMRPAVVIPETFFPYPRPEGLPLETKDKSLLQPVKISNARPPIGIYRPSLSNKQ